MSTYKEDLKKYFNFSGDVDECPLCHMKILPVLLYVHKREATAKSNYYEIYHVIFACPNNECNEVFIANYGKTYFEIYQNNYKLINIRPFNFECREFDDAINEISSMFIKIFNQAYRAEQLKLYEICGIGYRKALEFLIKDYLINTLEEDKIEAIKNPQLALGACINNYISDHRIKSNAERATWLGNDETHYVRIYDEFDISDMKKLIELTVFYIQSEILSGEYKEKIEKRK